MPRKSPVQTVELTVNHGVVTLAVTPIRGGARSGAQAGAQQNATARNRMQQLVPGKLVTELVLFQL